MSVWRRVTCSTAATRLLLLCTHEARVLSLATRTWRGREGGPSPQPGLPPPRPWSGGGGHLLAPSTTSVLTCRSKKKGHKPGYSKHKQEEEEEESGAESEEEEGEDRLEAGADYRQVWVTVSSLRMDAVLKAGLNMSRSKAEAAFYGSKIRVNGEKVLRKSHQIMEGDEIDVIKDMSAPNPKFLYISRIVVQKVGSYNEDSDRLKLKLCKYPQLLVERYDQGKQQTQQDDQ